MLLFFIYFWLLWVCCFSLVLASMGILHCGTQASQCSQAWALDTQTKLSVACGIFLDQESNLCPLHWQMDSYPLYHQGNFKPGIFVLDTWKSLYTSLTGLHPDMFENHPTEGWPVNANVLTVGTMSAALSLSPLINLMDQAEFGLSLSWCILPKALCSFKEFLTSLSDPKFHEITRKWSRLLIQLYPQAIQLPPFPFAHFHCRY